MPITRFRQDWNVYGWEKDTCILKHSLSAAMLPVELTLALYARL